MTEKGQVQIYTGNGKGKTTAAFGLCFRALGRGMKVCVAQFRKAVTCGEHIEAEKLGIPMILCKEGRKAKPCASPCPVLEGVRALLRDSPPDVLVLDEVMAAISKGCVTVDEVLELVAQKPEQMELILTGRGAPKKLIEVADLVTLMEPVKHYFQDGVLAREGIEY